LCNCQTAVPKLASIYVVGYGNKSAVDIVSSSQIGNEYHIDIYCGMDKAKADGINTTKQVVLISY
jgi:hypothetical protein